MRCPACESTTGFFRDGENTTCTTCDLKDKTTLFQVRLGPEKPSKKCTWRYDAGDKTYTDCDLELTQQTVADLIGQGCGICPNCGGGIEMGGRI
jgi:hypothetical protein